MALALEQEAIHMYLDMVMVPDTCKMYNFHVVCTWAGLKIHAHLQDAAVDMYMAGGKSVELQADVYCCIVCQLQCMECAVACRYSCPSCCCYCWSKLGPHAH